MTFSIILLTGVRLQALIGKPSEQIDFNVHIQMLWSILYSIFIQINKAIPYMHDLWCIPCMNVCLVFTDTHLFYPILNWECLCQVPWNWLILISTGKQIRCSCWFHRLTFAYKLIMTFDLGQIWGARFLIEINFRYINGYTSNENNDRLYQRKRNREIQDYNNIVFWGSFST